MKVPAKMIDGEIGSSVTIVNDLTTGGADAALSAEQGKTLKAALDAVETSASGTGYTETHTATASDVTAKGFALTNVVTTGAESQVVCVMNGVHQVYGTDYTVATANGKSTLSWSGLGIDTIGVEAGDVFTVTYSASA